MCDTGGYYTRHTFSKSLQCRQQRYSVAFVLCPNLYLGFKATKSFKTQH